MKKKEFRDALETLDFTHGKAAEVLDCDRRTIRKYAGAELPVPQLAAILLRGLLSGKFTVKDVEEWKC